MDGIARLREHNAAAKISLRDLADDLADYIAMRPESAATLDGLARFLEGLHAAAERTRNGDPRPAHGLLPGEARDIAANAPADRWVTVYQGLVDAAEAAGLGLDLEVHLLSRLAFWQLRLRDHELPGRVQGFSESSLRS